MAVYFIPRHCVDAVRAGTIRGLLASLRPDAGPRHGHVVVQGPVHLDVQRTADAPRARIAERACILRARLVMTRDALVRAIGVDGWSGPDGERYARLVKAAEQGAPGDTARAREALAKLLGFECWADIAGDDTVDNELIIWSAE